MLQLQGTDRLIETHNFTSYSTGLLAWVVFFFLEEDIGVSWYKELDKVKKVQTPEADTFQEFTMETNSLALFGFGSSRKYLNHTFSLCTSFNIT